MEAEKKESNASERVAGERVSSRASHVTETRSQFKHSSHKDGQHKKTNARKIRLGDIYFGLVIILALLIIVNIISAYSLNNDIKKSAEAAKERLKPAKIELAVVKNSKCTDCFNISTFVSRIKSAKVEITKENTIEFDSKEGKELVYKYKITRIPAIVVTGEIDKFAINDMEKKDDALLLSRIEPPYTDAATGKIEGRVTLYNIKDSACAKCNDLSPLIRQIKASGVKIIEEKTADSNSDEGKGLIKKYSINFVPTIVLSKEAGAYTLMQQAWLQIGSKESDGSFVLRLVAPPFINLSNGQLRGVVNIVYLTDKSCAECYDVNLHREILTNPQSFAVSLDKEEEYDISEAKGRELIAKYNITAVPTIIVSGELAAYPSIQVLKQFFSVENNGYYIFRKVQVLGAYKNLETNQVVKVQQAEAPPQ